LCFGVDSRGFGGRLPPSGFPGKQVKVNRAQFLQWEEGSISRFTEVDLLEIEPAEFTVDDSVLRLFFNSDIAERFVPAVFAIGTLESMKVPPGGAPGAERFARPFAMNIQKRGQGAANGAAASQPGLPLQTQRVRQTPAAKAC
jgi:hypothetical protein